MDNIDHILSGLAVLLSAIGAALGFRKHDSKKHEAALAARRELGLSYARSAHAVCLHRKTSPIVMTAALLDAFRLADTALDGKRDFTDAQARAFLDETAKEFTS